MREKIAEIICPDCQDKKEDGSCIWKNCSMYDKKQALEALFTAETAAMREAIEVGKDELWRLRHCSTERPERTLDVLRQIDTVLKGGK